MTLSKEGGMNSPDIYAPKSNPHGRSYSKWLELYVIKLLQAPEDVNPGYDQDGRYCDKMQEGDVYLLAGSFQGHYNRTFSIDEGKDLFLAAILKNDSHAEDNDLAPTDNERMIERLNEGISYVTNKFVEVDGKSVDNLDDFLVTTEIFSFNFPAKNVYKVTPGPTTGIAKGWAIMLKALPEGVHTIKFGGTAEIPKQSVIFDQLHETKIDIAVTYTLNVVATNPKQ